MHEKTFNLRFTLTAEIPAALLEDDEFDDSQWLREWESSLKPRIIRLLFGELRSFPGWEVRVRNRGVSPDDEVEVEVTRTYAPVDKPVLQ